eukprot:UN19555
MKCRFLSFSKLAKMQILFLSFCSLQKSIHVSFYTFRFINLFTVVVELLYD